MAAGLSQFTVSASAKADREGRLAKLKDNRDIRAEASGKKNPIVDELKDATASVPLPNRPVTPDQIERVMALADEGSTGSVSGTKKRGRPPKSAPAAAASGSAGSNDKRRNEALKKYSAYFRSPHLHKYCDNVQPNGSWDEATAMANLQRVRSNINRNSAPDWVFYIMRLGFMGLERGVNMGYVPNLLNWNLQPNPVTGETLSGTFARTYAEDTELQELCAELGAEFGLVAEQGLAQRALTKLAGVVNRHSDEHNKRVRVAEPEASAQS